LLLLLFIRNPELYPLFRGNWIDVLARRSVAQDKRLQHLQSNYTRGPDFVNPRTGRWYDMTTTRHQFDRRVSRYRRGWGSDYGFLPTLSWWQRAQRLQPISTLRR
jgi:hypothetical protein